MKGLLIKDFLLIRKHNSGFVLVGALFFCMSVFSENSMFFSYYSAAMITLMSVFTMAYDESYKWSKYEAVIPVKKSAIVLEKYILVFIITVPTITAETLILKFVKGISIAGTAGLAYLMFFTALLPPAIVLPFIFRFGYLKGKIVNLVVMGAMAASVTVITSINSTDGSFIEANFFPQSNAYLFAIAGIIIIFISMLISIILYKKREF